MIICSKIIFMKHLILLAIYMAGIHFNSRVLHAAEPVRYVAIGDSYSIGTGVKPDEAWPKLLTDHLKADGIDITLVANPSRNGWTTVDAQQFEMKVLRNSSPNFVTVMLGVNDWVQGFPDERFRQNFSDILDDVLGEVPAEKVLVINIPDFSVTPKGKRLSFNRDAAKGLAVFNRIIQEICREKGVALADIYRASQKMRDDPALIADDDLHPSAEGQKLFEQVIYPFAKKILSNTK